MYILSFLEVLNKFNEKRGGEGGRRDRERAREREKEKGLGMWLN